jgi:hypothetical protein
MLSNKTKNLKLVQSKDELKKDPAKVGEAVYKQLLKPTEMQSVGETLEAMTPRYYEGLLEAVNSCSGSYSCPFYVVVLRKKEPWALNVLRHWYVPRQTKPSAFVLREDYKNFDHDVWQVNGESRDISLMWTLPTKQDSDSILKNRWMYNEDLVKWIIQFNEGRLG